MNWKTANRRAMKRRRSTTQRAAPVLVWMEQFIKKLCRDSGVPYSAKRIQHEITQARQRMS